MFLLLNYKQGTRRPMLENCSENFAIAEWMIGFVGRADGRGVH